MKRIFIPNGTPSIKNLFEKILAEAKVEGRFEWQNDVELEYSSDLVFYIPENSSGLIVPCGNLSRGFIDNYKISEFGDFLILNKSLIKNEELKQSALEFKLISSVTFELGLSPKLNISKVINGKKVPLTEYDILEKLLERELTDLDKMMLNKIQLPDTPLQSKKNSDKSNIPLEYIGNPVAVPLVVEYNRIGRPGIIIK